MRSSSERTRPGRAGRLAIAVLVAAAGGVACEDDDGDGDDDGDDADSGIQVPIDASPGGPDAGGDGLADAGPDADADVPGSDAGPLPLACPGADPQLDVPAGICARVFADELGRARHLTVTPAGDVYVALADAHDGSEPGGIVALRDADGDGEAEIVRRFHDQGGNGILWRQGRLYFAENDRIVRWDLPSGQLLPKVAPDVVVCDLPVAGDHNAKSIVITPAGLMVNVGSPSNACQVENRVPGSPGIDPCPELDERAGIWRFDPERRDQRFAEGERWATGIRNANALAMNPDTGDLWAAVNGRDQLHENWPERFTPQDDQRLPGEEIIRIRRGDDHGWPYCYHDPEANLMVLAPEYGGDGEALGRCIDKVAPEQWLPAHWAPLGMHFLQGDALPAAYREGALVASHGSRFAPLAEEPPGYNVVFVPFEGGRPRPYVDFVSGFAGDARPLPEQARHRPVGVTEGPDGAVYISDDWGGRIWKLTAADGAGGPNQQD